MTLRRSLPLAVLLALPGLSLAQSDAAGMLTGGIRPVNPHLTSGSTIGEVTVATEGDEVAIFIEGSGFAPGRRMAHVHGFAEEDPREASCPSPGADANADGVVDLIETREAAGVTLIPLNGDPAALDLAGENYPRADETGEIDYAATISEAALTEALREARGTPPALARRVVMIQGVRETAALPDSARSLEGVPAHVAMPIACAELTAEE